MKEVTVKHILLALVALGLAVAPGAGANGSPYSPGLSGFDGVTGPNGSIRYVTIGLQKQTAVAAVRARTGKVVRVGFVRGFVGVPIVTYDGTTGGVSGDGKTLVLASYGPLPGTPGSTRFVLLNAANFKVRRSLELRGAWSYDAISPTGTRLYLIEHLAAPPSPRYRVRVVDVESGRLLKQSVIDRGATAAIMRGEPATRATSSDGRWAYTLYARVKHAPFVHALDTSRRLAYCIDLPNELATSDQMRLRLGLRAGGRELVVRQSGAPAAVIDTRTFAVHKH